MEFFFFLLFRAAALAYGGSQARGQNRTVTADLNHSHSNARSLSTCWVRSEIKPPTSWLLVGFLSTAPQWELLPIHYYKSNMSKCSFSSLISPTILKVFQDCYQFLFCKYTKTVVKQVFFHLHKSSWLNSMKCS